MTYTSQFNVIKSVRILFYVLFINTVIESFLLYFEDRVIIISLQLLLNGAYFIYVFLTLKKIKKPPHIKTITLLIGFLLLCSLFSSSLITTFNYLLKFSIPYFFYIIGYNIITNFRLLNLFLGKMWMFLAYFTIHIIVVNVLNIGESIYSGGIKVGYYSLNGLYIPTFGILLTIFFYTFIPTKKERILGLIFSLSTTVILIILLKRTLILLIIVGLLIYFLKTLSVKGLIRAGLLGLTFLMITSFFTDFISNSLESRSSRFDKEYDVSQEGRFTEILFIYDYMSNSPKSLVWGTGEVFNDRETVSKIYGVDREAHNSYIRLFWSGGFIGLAMYLSLCYKQYKLAKLNFQASKKQKNKEFAHLFFFIALFILLRFMNDFSSGITYLSYNAFSLVIIGGAFRLSQTFETLNTKDTLGSIEALNNKIVKS